MMTVSFVRANGPGTGPHFSPFITDIIAYKVHKNPAMKHMAVFILLMIEPSLYLYNIISLSLTLELTFTALNMIIGAIRCLEQEVKVI